MPKALSSQSSSENAFAWAWCSSCHPGCKSCCVDNISAAGIRRPDRADIIEMIRKRDSMKLAA